ncbi:MAG: alpha-L-fucosidase [Acidobacteriota bacterium]|jgi:alpha-L-fucosidase
MANTLRAVALGSCLAFTLTSVAPAAAAAGNRPERIQWFRDLGFGLFIHWSLDSQVTSVISHSMVGASDDYLERYATELTRTFNPRHFEPREWARLARLAGFTYVVFTAKHHSGFCMFETATTDFSIMHTPYGRDVTRELVDAFRAEGLAIGLYFSPDDFHFLHRQGTLISRRRPEAQPVNNAGLLAHDQAQLRELMTRYGTIDMVFIDGPPDCLKEVVWESDADALVTRGAMETPEQYTPGVPLEGAWEGNLTMGTQWQYRGTNETYKSGTDLINTLIETRAKGGNLLLNIGPRPDGVIPIEQEARMREIALWNLVNREAILGVRPWVLTNEGDVWFTKAKGASTVYAAVTRTEWPWGTAKTLTLRSVKATADTVVSVLGQNDEVLEYRPDVEPRTTFEQTPDGLRVTAWRAQRLYNDRRWPNPVVLKITHAEAGLEPPVVVTTEGRWDPASRTATLTGRLDSLGDAASVQVGFEYRRKKGSAEMYEKDDPWKALDVTTLSSVGEFRVSLTAIDSTRDYEFRAVVRHPKVTLRGQATTLERGTQPHR